VLGVCTPCAHYLDTDGGLGAHLPVYMSRINPVRQEGKAFHRRHERCTAVALVWEQTQ
jgi:hypothetical protein